MKNLGFSFSLLAFFVALLSGFYMRLPLWDNLIRSFVFYLIFSVLYLAVVMVINQITLDVVKQKKQRSKKSDRDDLDEPTPNMAK